jgi:hypothetical protein
MQQRGINALQLELIQTFGEDQYQKGGTILSFIPERKLALLRKAIDRLSRVATVKSEEENTITVMHLERRVRKTELVA